MNTQRDCLIYNPGFESTRFHLGVLVCVCGCVCVPGQIQLSEQDTGIIRSLFDVYIAECEAALDRMPPEVSFSVSSEDH